jgi:hypothetical protein
MQTRHVGKGGIIPPGDDTFFCVDGEANHHLGTDECLYNGIMLAIKPAEIFL